MGVTKLQIGGIVAALCVIMFIVALAVDQLFRECPMMSDNTKVTGTCGWKEMRMSEGGSTFKWKDMKNENGGDKWTDQEPVGEIWLAFGILTVLTGTAGCVVALVPQLDKHKMVAHSCCVFAGIFGILASAFPFKGECAKDWDCDAGASVLIGLIFAIGFFVAAILMLLK